jgi:F0F1-type ATP synthase delta subunit
MKAIQYAEALYRAIRHTSTSEEADRVIASLVRLLAAQGHTRLLAKIIVAYEKIVRRHGSAAGAQVRVRTTEAVAYYKDRMTADLHALNADGMPVQVHIDPTCIGGYEVRAHGQRIDRTHKRTLIRMFETISRT